MDSALYLFVGHDYASAKESLRQASIAFAGGAAASMLRGAQLSRTAIYALRTVNTASNTAYFMKNADRAMEQIAYMQVYDVSLFGSHTDEELEHIATLEWALLGCLCSGGSMISDATSIAKMAQEDQLASRLRDANSKGANVVKIHAREFWSDNSGALNLEAFGLVRQRGESGSGRKTLYHYTNEKGLTGITETNQLNPSLKLIILKMPDMEMDNIYLI